jgi:hypothetical protein
MTFAEARALEAFKSPVHIAVPGLKLLALLNGGAAVALLAYLGNVAGKGMPTPDVRVPMWCYLIGLVLCGLGLQRRPPDAAASLQRSRQSASSTR